MNANFKYHCDFIFTDHSPFKYNDSLSLLFLTVSTKQKGEQDHVKSKKTNNKTLSMVLNPINFKCSVLKLLPHVIMQFRKRHSYPVRQWQSGHRRSFKQCQTKNDPRTEINKDSEHWLVVTFVKSGKWEMDQVNHHWKYLHIVVYNN